MENAAIHGAGQGIGQLIAALFMRNRNKGFNNLPLGQALGYEATTPPPTMRPTPGPIRSMRPDMPPLMPTGAPVTGPGGAMSVPAPVTYLGAPPAAQPLLSQPVKNLARLRSALGDTQTTNLLASMGLGRGQADAMQLEYDEKTGEFKVRPGTAAVSARNANVILRQKDIAAKKDLGAWREAVEKRLARGQVTREERLALEADSDLLGFMLSPQFDLMDDTIKEQYEAQATAALNRLQQRGVTVFTGSRKPKAPAPGTPAPTAPPKPAAPPVEDLFVRRTRRYAEIKAQMPSLTDEQIASQIAIEEQSAGE